jgi:hypothetical protein
VAAYQPLQMAFNRATCHADTDFLFVWLFFLPIDSISRKAVIVLGQRGLFLPCLQKRIYLDQYRMLLGPKLLSLEQSENDVF